MSGTGGPPVAAIRGAARPTMIAEAIAKPRTFLIIYLLHDVLRIQTDEIARARTVQESEHGDVRTDGLSQK